MKFILCFFGIWVSIAAWTQSNPPIWVHAVYRQINYPPEKWHTGFVQDRLKANGDAGNMLKIMERDAINQLAESIIITVESETQVENTNQQRGGNDKSGSVTTNLKQKVKTVTSATLVNLDINSYYDPETGMLYAFAAIKRSDLATWYQNQLTSDLSKLETAIAVLKKHISAGQKNSARSKIKEATHLLEDIRFYRTMISVSNTGMNDNKLLPTGREDELHRTLEQTLAGFNTNFIVYINCQLEQKGAGHDVFTKDPHILCDILTQALNENECQITGDIRKADFELKIITSTTQRSDGNDPYGIISYYANAKCSLYDRAEKKQLVDFIILNDPNVYAAGNSPEDAAIKAFKLPVLKNRILEKILPVINN